MAAGCPVIAANAGGIPDIVTNGINGFMFDPTDEGGAIMATQKLLGMKAERELLRQNARVEAERWGWEASTRQLESFYEEVLGKGLAIAA